MLEGALRLLCGGGAEDFHQLLIHLVHPIGGGCGQSVQERGHNGTIGMARVIGVPSDSGVVAMGTTEVTTLQPQEMGKLELPPSLEVESSSLVNSLRMVCSDGDPP
jgi:hypothetical protein